MAYHHHHDAPASAPPMECARTEQIIAHFIHRSLHLILDARIPSAVPKPRPAAAASRRKDKWFQLDLWDVIDASSSSYPPWHHPILEPMLVDIVLLPDPDPYSPRPAAKETVLERWIVQYEPLPVPTASYAAAADAGVLLFRKMYKKMLILMRSLYSALRFLPAYRVYRMRRCGDFRVSYKVSNFGEPFTRAEEEGMRVQGFAPVEAAHGRVSVSVTYRASLSDLNFGPSSPYPPQIIADYVGSPAAEPIKIFHSSGAYYSSSTRGYRSTPSASSSSPFIRPHSWTSGIHQPVPASSAPTHFSPPDIGGGRAAGYRPIPRKKAISFDDQGFSPPFSPSPSPSTSPSPSPASSPLYARLRSESTSTPVNIPLPMMGKGSGGGRYWSPNLSDPNKQFLPPPSPRSFKGENSSGSPAGSRSFRRLDGLRGADNYSGSSNLQGYGGQKVRDSKDDSGRFSGVVSSNGSPRIGFSRSSSRLSFQDDLDDCEFSCPFAVDDVIDSSETSHRTSVGKESGESSSNHALPSSRTSQDAAVGILVHMLKTAPPLRQDHSYISESSKSQYGEGGSSAFFMSRKTSDALEELRSYKEMKDLLLSQSGTQLLGSFKHRSNSLSE